MSNVTCWPSFSVRRPAACTAVTCTNTSLPPPSGEMKPKPLVVLKNFTVPVVISVFHFNDFTRGEMPFVNAGDFSSGKVFDCLVRARTQGGQGFKQRVRFFRNGTPSAFGPYTRLGGKEQSGGPLPVRLGPLRAARNRVNVPGWSR